MKKIISLVSTILKMRTPSYLLKRVLELGYGYPLYCLSYLFPRNNNKWVFGTNVGFADNAKYLYIYTMIQNDNIKPIWICPTEDIAQKIRTIGGRAFTKYSIKGLYHSLTASKYIFTYHSNDINFFTSGRTKKINLWHGVGIKGSSGGKKNKDKSFKASITLTRFLMPYYDEKIDLFLSTSVLMNKHFKKMFDLEDSVIFDSVYPRCYFLTRTKKELLSLIDRFESKSILDLVNKVKSFNKSFLYMPTWRGNLKDDFIKKAGFNFHELNKIMNASNSVFIFKLHPAVKILEDFKPDTFSNIIFLDKSVDVYPVLPFISTLITDYSSIYYDFILLNKEVILFPFDKEEYLDLSNDLAFDYDQFTPGYRVYTMKELYNAISSNDSHFINEIENIRNLFWDKSDINNLKLLYERIKLL